MIKFCVHEMEPNIFKIVPSYPDSFELGNETRMYFCKREYENTKAGKELALDEYLIFKDLFTRNPYAGIRNIFDATMVLTKPKYKECLSILSNNFLKDVNLKVALKTIFLAKDYIRNLMLTLLKLNKIQKDLFKIMIDKGDNFKDVLHYIFAKFATSLEDSQNILDFLSKGWEIEPEVFIVIIMHAEEEVHNKFIVLLENHEEIKLALALKFNENPPITKYN